MHLAPGKPPTVETQVGFSWYLAPQQALVQALQQPLRSSAAASSHLTLLLGHTCCTWGLLHFLLAVHRPSQELRFQAAERRSW